MTTYIPTVWTNDINNTTVVGMFQDKDEAIRALFQKIVEENLLNITDSYYQDNNNYIQAELFYLVYNDYMYLEDKDESTNQNLNFLVEHNNEDMFKEFGRSWGFKMEMDEPEPAIVMK